MLRTLLCTLVLVSAAVSGEARWLRYPAISPDGKWVAFSYRGDLWKVPAAGGEARPLTTHVGYERSPVWSPDSRSIAFASDRHGNFDVFVVGADGGPERRLTFHSSHDIPTCWGKGGTEVVFESRRLDAPEACVGTPWMAELYAVSVEGGRPRQLLTTPAESARLSPDGARLAYHDRKGWGNPWRKHQVSPLARDLWVVDLETNRHTRVTSYRGEDRNPVWSKSGKELHFLSERGGSFNVWRIAEPWSKPEQVTRHGPFPVRFLSISDEGVLCYAYDGGIHVGGRAISVRVSAGAKTNAVRAETQRKGATGFAVSPNEEEIAFVLRGDVHVASTKHGTTKRVTATPEQERSVTWAPDGRTIYYAGERGGSWNLYGTSLARKEEEFFFHSTRLEEKPVLVTDDETFQPLASPDGKWLAYVFNRDEIRVLHLETKKSRTLIPAERNYSYRDGDIDFAWSPDSRWLAATFVSEGRWIDDIALVRVDGGDVVDLTLSGYYEWNPRWSADGKAILFISNRLGRKQHGSWGGGGGDVFALYLTQAAYDEAQLSEEDYELLHRKEKEKKKAKKKRKKEGKDDDEEEKKKKKKKIEPVVIELEGRENRLKRLTIHSAPIESFALSPDGETLVYFAQVEEKWDLWQNEIRKSSTSKLLELGDDRPGRVVFSEEDDAVFVLSADGSIRRVELKGKPKRVPYAAEVTVDGPRERAYILEHCWRQTKRKFYEPTLHGVDWDAVKAHYAAFLPELNNNHDFAQLLSEMVGELNASHTGSGYRIPQEGTDRTAALGLLYDVKHTGAGLKIAEVVERGPVDRAGPEVPTGSLLVRIDGVELGARTNHHALLNRKAGKRVLLAFTTPDGKTIEKVVRPIEWDALGNLLYLRWRKQRRELTDKLSRGRIGYVHVRGMGDRSYRHLFQEALGRHRNKLALIVDTRFNGGGWLHDDLVTFLGGKQYATFQPRGKERGSLGGEPLHRWYRPVAVLQNEGNYSDAHFFPYAFKQLGIGKLVGAPVAGTATAVWWERQIDRTLTYGIPQIGVVTPEGKYLENLELRPDVEVYNDPESVAKGRDKQLEKAVEVLLAGLK